MNRFMMTTPLAVIQHLDATYTTLTPQDLEIICLELSKPCNPDSPIQDLWASADNIRHLAANGDASISQVTAITLLLAMFESSGLLASTTKKLRLTDPVGWTLTAFEDEINRDNAERLCRFTTDTSGYCPIECAPLTAISAPLSHCTRTQRIFTHQHWTIIQCWVQCPISDQYCQHQFSHSLQSVATVKGYLNQNCKNLRSTKPWVPTTATTLPIPNKDNNDDRFPASDIANQLTHNIHIPISLNSSCNSWNELSNVCLCMYDSETSLPQSDLNFPRYK